MADAAHFPAFVLRAVGFGCVLHHHKAVLLRKLHQRAHVARMAVHVNSHDRSRAGRDLLLNLRHIDAPVARIGIRENGLAAGQDDHVGACNQVERRNDDLIARLQIENFKSQMERGRAAAAANGMLDPATIPDHFLEPVQEFSGRRDPVGFETFENVLLFIPGQIRFANGNHFNHS